MTKPLPAILRCPVLLLCVVASLWAYPVPIVEIEPQEVGYTGGDDIDLGGNYTEEHVGISDGTAFLMNNIKDEQNISASQVHVSKSISTSIHTQDYIVSENESESRKGQFALQQQSNEEQNPNSGHFHQQQSNSPSNDQPNNSNEHNGNTHGNSQQLFPQGSNHDGSNPFHFTSRTPNQNPPLPLGLPSSFQNGHFSYIIHTPSGNQPQVSHFQTNQQPIGRQELTTALPRQENNQFLNHHQLQVDSNVHLSTAPTTTSTSAPITNFPSENPAEEPRIDNSQTGVNPSNDFFSVNEEFPMQQDPFSLSQNNNENNPSSTISDTNPNTNGIQQAPPNIPSSNEPVPDESLISQRTANNPGWMVVDDLDTGESNQTSVVAPSQKFGYIVQNSDFKRFRYEEKTPEGLINGEFGIHHNNGVIRGVRYTADPTINPKFLYLALLKFMSM